MRISDFEWDDSNAPHLALDHGIEPEEAEEVLALRPLYRRTKLGHYAAFGRTRAGRLLVLVFEKKRGGYGADHHGLGHGLGRAPALPAAPGVVNLWAE